MNIYRVRVEEDNNYEKYFETLEGAFYYVYHDFISELGNCSVKFENYASGMFEFTLLYDTEEESFWKNRKILVECIKVYNNKQIEEV